MASCGYILVMEYAGIRELRNNLSRYLRKLKGGHVIAVTDRGQVVAELRAPDHDPAGAPHAAAIRAVRARVRRVTSMLTIAESPRALIRAYATRRIDTTRMRAAVRALQTFAARWDIRLSERAQRMNVTGQLCDYHTSV